MTVHLVKLCVGIDSIDELSRYRDDLATKLKKRRRPLEDQHVTRTRPKRDAEVLDGGSLYWVIRGIMCVRHRILRLDDVALADRDGGEGDTAYCAIVYDPTVIVTEPRPRRPFRGWRYLEAEDAPPDLTDQRAALRQVKAEGKLPAELMRELKTLGLM